MHTHLSVTRTTGNAAAPPRTARKAAIATAAIVATVLGAVTIAAGAAQADVPEAPTNLTVDTGTTAGQAVVSYSPGAPLTGEESTSFVATATDLTTPANGGQTATDDPAGDTITVTGLVDGDTYTFTVTAIDTSGESATSAPSDPAVVGLEPGIAGTAPDGTVGQPYTYQYAITGDPTPVVDPFGPLVNGHGCAPPSCSTSSAPTAELPPGLSLSASGALSGTPTTAGSYVFAPEASNALGTTESAQIVLTIAARVPPAITTDSLPTATAGTAYNAAVSGNGVPAPTFTATGLPPGLTITPAGAITGTPTAAAAYTITITATNPIGSASQVYTLTVNPPKPISTRADLTITVSGPPAAVHHNGAVAYTFKVTNNGPANATNVLTAAAISPGVAVTGTSSTVWHGSAFGISGLLFVTNSLASGASLSYSVNGSVSAAAGKLIGASAITGSDQADPNRLNNLAAVSEKVS
jgi:uncharacterized repeat protein (TIGR01451 family)